MSNHSNQSTNIISMPDPASEIHSNLKNLHQTATNLSDQSNPDLIPAFPDHTEVESTECQHLASGGYYNEKKRTFVLVDYPKPGKTYGYYKGKYPKQVAKKVANFLSKKHNIGNNDQKFIVFTIKEITKNSKNKEYKYIGTRVKLNKPNKVEYNGKIIYHNYNILVTKYDNNFNNSFIVNKIV